MEGRAALGHAPWEHYEPTSSSVATWLRFDDPPVADDGALDPLGVLTLADRMPGCVGERIGPGGEPWFAPSADLTVHLLERRRHREVTGMRRYRPGPGRLVSSPAVAGPPAPAALDSEIQAIQRALDEHGATERRELAQMVGARYWGPGVFRHALREAVAEGLVRPTSHNTFASAGEDGPKLGAGDQRGT